MTKHMAVVLRKSVEGHEAEFNEWYEKTHIREALESTSWKNAQPFVLTAEKGPKCPLRHLALYEAEARSGEDVVAKLDPTRNQREQSGSFNRKCAGLWVFSETGPKHERGSD
jgi:hypothetical protein